LFAQTAKSGDIKLMVTQPYGIEIIEKFIARLYSIAQGTTTFRMIIKYPTCYYSIYYFHGLLIILEQCYQHLFKLLARTINNWDIKLAVIQLNGIEIIEKFIARLYSIA
jgi:hypothetical protein